MCRKVIERVNCGKCDGTAFYRTIVQTQTCDMFRDHGWCEVGMPHGPDNPAVQTRISTTETGVCPQCANEERLREKRREERH